jgi:hypothetical protein
LQEQFSEVGNVVQLGFPSTGHCLFGAPHASPFRAVEQLVSSM